MKSFKNILASEDARSDLHPSLDWAAMLAQHNGAKLKIVDALPEFAWHIRQAMRDHDEVRAALLDDKRQRLEKLAAPLREKGLEVSTAALSGHTSVEIIREVLRSEHDLVVRVAKGTSSRRADFFGSTSLRLLRKCPCPVWIVKPGTAPRFRHILGAVDPDIHDNEHKSLNAAIIRLTQSIAQSEQCSFSLIHAWTIYGEQMFKSRMSEDEFADLEATSHKGYQTLLNKLLSAYGLSTSSDNVHLVKGEPSRAIPHFVATHDVDLLVMGTVGRSGISGTIMGNTAEMVLSRIQCAVLALKPQGFVSPVSL